MDAVAGALANFCFGAAVVSAAEFAAAELAVAAAAEHGFNSPHTDYAVTVSKVAIGRAVGPVTSVAHQLHGAIGVTSEHPLWLFTLRAQSWTGDYGTTAHFARRLGRLVLAGLPERPAARP